MSPITNSLLSETQFLFYFNFHASENIYRVLERMVYYKLKWNFVPVKFLCHDKKKNTANVITKPSIWLLKMSYKNCKIGFSWLNKQIKVNSNAVDVMWFCVCFASVCWSLLKCLPLIFARTNWMWVCTCLTACTFACEQWIGCDYGEAL